MTSFRFADGSETFVDEEDYWFLSQFIWQIDTKRNQRQRYVCRGVTEKGKSRKIYMHLEVAERMGLDLNQRIDHHDQDTLNNQRYNLRSASNSQNAINGPVRLNNRLGIKGVSYDKRRGKYEARIQKDGTQYFLGYYDDPEEAGRIYKDASKFHYGEFAPP